MTRIKSVRNGVSLNKDVSQDNLEPVNSLNLPNEVIQKSIAPYFSPKEALAARFVCRQFAVLFGDNYIWSIYYQALGLQAPTILPEMIEELSLSPLAKTLPLWISLQKTIETSVKKNGENVFSQIFPRTFCVAALALPELLPLHSYAIGVLKKLCNVSEELTVDELYLNVARGDRSFIVQDGARILVLKLLSNRAVTPSVQQMFLSIINNRREKAFCSIAAKGLAPYLTSPEGKNTLLAAIREQGSFAMLPALNRLAITPEILDAVLDSFLGGCCGLYKIVGNHLNNPAVVNQLVQRLTATNSSLLLSELTQALQPVSNQIPVQKALCQRLLNMPDGLAGRFHAHMQLNKIIHHEQLAEEVIEEFGERIPKLRELANAYSISQLTPCINLEHRKQLLHALSCLNQFMRVAAAKLLAPLVADDPEILAAFLERVDAKDFGEVGIAVVSGLAKVAHREDVRTILIEKGCLDGNLGSTRLENPALRIATIQVLAPFLNVPEVRQTLINRFENDGSSNVRCALIEILAPQINEEDVLSLFLKCAEDKLWRQSYYSCRESQVAAIDKLASVVNIPEVQNLLLKLFEESSFNLKAACIRSLCSDKNSRLIGIDKIFIACIDQSKEVRKEARRVLALWTHTDN